MNRFLLRILAALAAILLNSCTAPEPPAGTAARSDLLILVSIDGFRWDYLQKYPCPELRGLAASGAHARRMNPSFPSLTFPNHYTLVTGLRPEHHGIVANTFREPGRADQFKYTSHESSIDPTWWAGGEPVWITAERQGVRSACFFWPGSEAENHGLRPSFFRQFDKHLTCDQRVDGLLEWLALPRAQRPRLATLYFDVVDSAGHTFGPDAPETAAAVATVDAALGRLRAGLAKLGLRDRTDLVLVSDHGMEPVSAERTILLDDYVPLDAIEVDFAGSVAGLRPKSGTPAELVARFRGRNPHLQAWLREEVPARLHYRASNHIAPVVLCAEPGWLIVTRDFLRVKRATFERGAHGFDPDSPNMGALFIAQGPSFKRGHEFASTDNIQVYDLVCAALGIKPAPNDGDDRLVREALANPR